MSDYSQNDAFTVWNDRSQGGSVHYDGRIKLLIDRRVKGLDLGGLTQSIYLNQTEPLVLNFRFKMHKYDEIKPEFSHHRRQLLAISSNNFELKHPS